MMWVSPVDWAGDDGRFHLLAYAHDSQTKNSLILYKHAKEKGLKFLYGAKQADAKPGRDYAGVASSTAGWQRGEWHHVVATWGEGRIALYIDGVLEAERTGVPSVATLGKTLSLYTNWPPRAEKPDTAIDEMKIFSRPVTESERRDYSRSK